MTAQLETHWTGAARLEGLESSESWAWMRWSDAVKTSGTKLLHGDVTDASHRNITATQEEELHAAESGVELDFHTAVSSVYL